MNLFDKIGKTKVKVKRDILNIIEQKSANNNYTHNSKKNIEIKEIIKIITGE